MGILPIGTILMIDESVRARVVEIRIRERGNVLYELSFMVDHSNKEITLTEGEALSMTQLDLEE